MASQKTDLAAAAHYIKSVGLPWADKVTDIFEREIRPEIMTRHANFKTNVMSVAMATRWRILPTFEQGRVHARDYLVRRLRSFECVASAIRVVDGTPKPLEVIVPELWEVLKDVAGSNTVSSSDLVFENVYVADTSLLWPQQKEAIRKTVFKRSVDVARTLEAQQPASARGQKTEAIKAWFVGLARKPRTQSAAMALARKHFERQLAKKEMSDETIRIFIVRQYPKEGDVASPNIP